MEKDFQNSNNSARVEKEDSAALSRHRKHYKILKEENIKQLQENDISTLSRLLSVSRGVACTLLCLNKWNLTSLYNEKFSGDETERQHFQKQEHVCKICSEKTRPEKMASAACGHPFCAHCWKMYIATSINDGPDCLKLLCPEPFCQSSVGLEMVNMLSSEDDKDKYFKHLSRSYVEAAVNRKWCPAPGCDFAVEFDVDGACKTYQVTCDCSHSFCWNCTEENHHPVDCTTVANWIEKNRSETEDSVWMLAYTKKCPKCNVAIERKYGCNEVTCRSPCGFRFCWACLRSWKSHKGSHFSCTKYERRGGGGIQSKSRINSEESRRMKAKKGVERYQHCYERWNYNEGAMRTAVVELNRTRHEYVDVLTNLQGESQCHDGVQFVIEAWEQIVECRRVLKWSYAYGYYLFCGCFKKMNLFASLQKEAEEALERLHYCSEKEMDKYLHFPRPDFKDFRLKLTRLTAVARNCLEKLVREVEINSLSEGENCGTKTREATENQKPGKNSMNNKPGKRSTYAAMYA